jgi:periplasmic protein TonB
MVTTLNTFPPLHSFNSPRSWMMAVVILLHALLFVALTTGRTIIAKLPNRTVVVFPEDLTKAPPPPPPPPIDYRVKPIESFVPQPPAWVPIEPSENTIRIVSTDPPPAPTAPPQVEPSPQPVIVEPAINPRTGLSEPVYPPAEIRLEHEGTVVLSIHVLENGRVGDVRLERSSGYARLDEAAMREARRWRLLPGTRDGAPVAMWKQVPIRFRLENAR